MKILLTGSSGLFGLNFLHLFSKKYEVLAIHNSTKGRLSFKNVRFLQLDLRNLKKLEETIVNFNPDLIIHAASYGDVDFCQSNKKEAYLLNTTVTSKIAQVSKEQNIKLIYLSTNAIFDGQKPPYSEKSKPNPINYYGYTKLEGEKKIREHNPDYIIIRLMTMYGWCKKTERENPAVWIIRKLSKKVSLKIVTDIYNNYLYAPQAAEIVDRLIGKWSPRDTFNLAGADTLNRYQFAKKIAKVFELDPSIIEPVKNDYFRNIAPRPKDTSFNMDKIKKYLKYKPLTTSEGLSHMKKNHITF